MSWLFSRALVEEFSAATSSDGGPSAPLNLMPTARPFLRKGKTTDFSDLSPFGPMCAPLTEDRGEALLRWCQEASRAKTSAAPGKVKASQGREVVSGKTWPESFARWSPSSSTWKTAQYSLLGDWMSYSGTWPRSGSMRSGTCFRREKLALGTFDSESGSLLPTPSGVNGGRNNTMGRIDEWGGSSNPLRGTVIGSMCLPEFEEMVMGWPIGWTALTPLETGKFQQWQRLHSPLSQTSSKEAA
jgi:hypothetical protein